LHQVLPDFFVVIRPLLFGQYAGEKITLTGGGQKLLLCFQYVNF